MATLGLLTLQGSTVNAQNLVISGGVQTIPGGTYDNITIQNGARGILVGDIVINGTMLVQAGGVLQTISDGNATCSNVSGPGNFILAARAQLSICSPAGISASGPLGNIQVSGTRTFSRHARYLYDRPGTQATGSGLPTQVWELYKFDTGQLNLSQAVAVRSQVGLISVGDISTNGQLLTLRSDADSTAYVMNYDAGVVMGSVTVRRYVGGPTAAGYHHLSSPVQSTTVADLSTTGYTAKVNAAYNSLPTPPLTAAQMPTVFGFDESRGGTNPQFQDFKYGYYSPETLGDVLTPGRGWVVYMGGNKTPDFVGELTTGVVPVALSLTGTNPSPNQFKAGWHLLGNPYPSPIDWDNVDSTITGMTGSISVFRTGGGRMGSFYLTYANGVGSLPGGIVPVGQGFFTRVTAPTVFAFTNAMRVADNPIAVARGAADTRPVFSLTLHDAQGAGDETFVYAQAGATPGSDDWFDGFKPGRNEGVATLATLVGEGEAAVNGLPESVLTQPATVELLADVPAAARYELAVGQWRNWGGTAVALVDRLTGTRYDLAQQPVVTFTAERAGEVRGRFALEFNAARVTGLASDAAMATLAVWPNPAHGTVRLGGVGAGAPVQLLDAVGRVVRTVVAGADGASFDVQTLPAGVYVVRSGAQTQRLVVE